jgi:hypothetical protein
MHVLRVHGKPVTLNDDGNGENRHLEKVAS